MFKRQIFSITFGKYVNYNSIRGRMKVKSYIIYVPRLFSSPWLFRYIKFSLSISMHSNSSFSLLCMDIFMKHYLFFLLLFYNSKKSFPNLKISFFISPHTALYVIIWNFCNVAHISLLNLHIFGVGILYIHFDFLFERNEENMLLRHDKFVYK